MMKTYSHPRRKALDAAAAVLEPVLTLVPSVPAGTTEATPEDVTSHVTSQSAKSTSEAVKILRNLARRTGRFPQLAHPRSCLTWPVLDGFARVSRESSAVSECHAHHKEERKDSDGY
jgi:hypothetical protein